MAVPVSALEQVDEERRHVLEDIEIDLLLEGLYQFYGDDFRGYERAALKQKLLDVMQASGLSSISALQDQVLHREPARAGLLHALGSRETALFEHDDYLRALGEVIGPLLRSYANPRIWLAEPASAEEVFTLAILLEEEGLYDKTTLFVTSSNDAVLREARQGSFACEKMADYEGNYRRWGGRHSLAGYCRGDNGKWSFLPQLMRNITWAQSSLATDTSFNEFQLILCNSLTDFGAPLRRRALGLFNESLVRFGILGVNRASDFESAPFFIHYKTISQEHGLYRRTG